MGKLFRLRTWKFDTMLLVAATAVGYVAMEVASPYLQPSSPISSGEPGLHFMEADFDAGTVRDFREKTVHHDFAFRNTLDRPVTIRDVRTTCGCTVADVPKDAIPPGGTGVLPVNMTLGHLGPLAAGIAVLSDDPGSPHQLRLQAAYQPGLAIKLLPRRVAVSPDGRAAVDVIVLHADPLPAEVLADPLAHLSFEADGPAVAEASTVDSSPYRAAAGYFSTAIHVTLRLDAGRGELRVVGRDALSGRTADAMLAARGGRL